MSDSLDQIRLDEIQDELLDQLHAGQAIDRAAVLRSHPEHAEALAAFLDLLEVVEGSDDAGLPPTSLGEYRIIREIGRGGMGIVYEAEQTSLKRPVALKVLPPSLRMDTRLVGRFQREAEAAGRLRHPGIVPVHAVGEAGGAPFFAMEYVPGLTLREVIRLRGEGESAGLSTDPDIYRTWAVETCVQVADALTYAHGEGIVHRDVKPGNILLGEDWTPRLTDFGLARDLRSPGLSLTGEVLGSPQYMSPEQAIRHDHPVDERTDVYSLAVTLYQLLTLQLPYDATTHAELLMALAAGRIVPPRQTDSGISKPLEQVLLRALQEDPRDRYPDAASFAADLRAALKGRAPARAVRTWAKPLAGSLLLALASAVIIGLLVHAGGSGVPAKEPAPRVAAKPRAEPTAVPLPPASDPATDTPALSFQETLAAYEAHGPGKPGDKGATRADFAPFIQSLRVFIARTELTEQERKDARRALAQVYTDFIAGPGVDDQRARAFLGHLRYEHDLPEAITQRDHAYVRAVEWASEKRWFTDRERQEYALAERAWILTERYLERLVHDPDFNRGDRASATLRADPKLQGLVLRTKWQSPYLFCHASRGPVSPFDALRIPDDTERKRLLASLPAREKEVDALLAHQANVLGQLRNEYWRRYGTALRLAPLMSPWGGSPGAIGQGQSYRDGVPLVVSTFEDDELYSERVGRPHRLQIGHYRFSPRVGSIYLSAEAERTSATLPLLLSVGVHQLEFWFTRQRNRWYKPPASGDFFRTGFPLFLASAEQSESGKLLFHGVHSYALKDMQTMAKEAEKRAGRLRLFPLRKLVSASSRSEAASWAAASWRIDNVSARVTYQSQAWALVYFLHNAKDGAYRDRLLAFHDLVLHREFGGEEGDAAFREAFRIRDDEDWQELEYEFHTYVRETLLKMEIK